MLWIYLRKKTKLIRICVGISTDGLKSMVEIDKDLLQEFRILPQISCAVAYTERLWQHVRSTESSQYFESTTFFANVWRNEK